MLGIGMYPACADAYPRGPHPPDDCSLMRSDTHHAHSLTMRTDHPDRFLPAYRRGTLRGMDAA
ncbi:hypothetical protein FHT13_001445 [Xanthomonas arboricola]|nr:hypothetical protein [Xanthomonas arboricola]